MLTKKDYHKLLGKIRSLRHLNYEVKCDCRHIKGTVVAAPISEDIVYVCKDGISGVAPSPDDRIIGLSHRAFHSRYEFNYSFYVEFRKTIGEIRNVIGDTI